jgi:U6 snRNA-associated Sm-like protein LSm2
LQIVLISHVFPPVIEQIFYSFFKTLIGQTISVELKNDMVITGTLQSVDQFLNIKVTDIQVEDVERFPHMVKTAK